MSMWGGFMPDANQNPMSMWQRLQPALGNLGMSMMGAAGGGQSNPIAMFGNPYLSGYTAPLTQQGRMFQDFWANQRAPAVPQVPGQIPQVEKPPAVTQPSAAPRQDVISGAYRNGVIDPLLLGYFPREYR